jgi:hypothetical protein
MKLVITTKFLKEAKLDPNSISILFLLYHKLFDDIKEVFGKDKAISIRNSLIETPYILSYESTHFTKTILAKSEIEKLFGLRSDKINFWEFYNCYPVKTNGGRILRGNSGTQLAEKHEKKYLSKVKTISQHEEAIKAVTAYVQKKKNENSMEYMEAMDRVINNSLWETWKEFTKSSLEGRNTPYWNTEAI